MAQTAFAEQRREHRQRVLKGAAVLTNMSNSAVSCTIRNMHRHGAELRVADGVNLPHAFLLYVPVDAIAYRSEVRWRREGRVGVMFTSTEQKPNWHFG